MVEPLAAANRDAVVAGEPLFTSGFDEFFALTEEKFFEINGRCAFLLLWMRINSRNRKKDDKRRKKRDSKV